MGDFAPQYWAFISYSHRDAKAAARLQRWLETYRIPQRLQGPREGIGDIRSYLKPIFRDRSELQAGADLKATVREALARSRYLIVVCSPDAARSPWVAQEIVEFQKLRGASHVLALIVAGEPFASRIPGRESEECFPAPLREGEPIAADLRPQGDGPRLALLKLVAGMIGVGVDELVRRDAQRRARRMALIATGSVAGMAVMAVLTLMAVQSRNEAHSQRAQAEDLLEFMLGDLRKKLVPVGRLDVLDAVGSKALAYYGNQDPGTLDADALGRRSRALHLIGEMRNKRGQLEESQAAFESAAQTTGELLQRSPGDSQRIFDHAQSVYWVGYAARQRGQLRLAEDSFAQYLLLAQKLVAIDPGKVDSQLETAYANQSLGVVQLQRRDLEAALRSFAAARDTLARLIALRPALGHELADAHGWIAQVREREGDYAAGIEAQRRRLQTLGAMPEAERDRRIQSQMAIAHATLGHFHLLQGDAASAEHEMRAAVERMEGLVASDPANMVWLSELTLQRLRWAEIERLLGKQESARIHIDQAAADTGRLVQKDASSLWWQIELKGALLSQQTSLAISQGREPPFAQLEEFVANARRTEAAGNALSSVQAEMLVTVETLLGDALAGAGRRDAAVAHWSAVMARLQAAGENAGNWVLTMRARMGLRLGEAAEAREILKRIEASNYRHPAFADLVNETRQVPGTVRSTISRK